MVNTKLSPPWITFVNEIKALFDEDPDVKIEYDNENYKVNLYVEDNDKAEALDKILPREKMFGSVCLKITVIPANKERENVADLITKAFKGNPAFQRVESVTPAVGGTLNYVLFTKKVVQFYNDDLSSYNGMCSTLYQDIAKDVLTEVDGTFYCTDFDESEN